MQSWVPWSLFQVLLKLSRKGALCLPASLFCRVWNLLSKVEPPRDNEGELLWDMMHTRWKAGLQVDKSWGLRVKGQLGNSTVNPMVTSFTVKCFCFCFLYQRIHSNNVYIAVVYLPLLFKSLDFEISCSHNKIKNNSSFSSFFPLKLLPLFLHVVGINMSSSQGHRCSWGGVTEASVYRAGQEVLTCIGRGWSNKGRGVLSGWEGRRR